MSHYSQGGGVNDAAILEDGIALTVDEIVMTLRDLSANNIKQAAEIERLKTSLFLIANIAHHGGLMGQDIEDIRRLTLPRWDKQEVKS